MARDEQGHWVVSERAADGAGCARRADVNGELAVAAGLATRNAGGLQQHLAMEVAYGAQVERQLRSPGGIEAALEHPRDIDGDALPLAWHATEVIEEEGLEVAHVIDAYDARDARAAVRDVDIADGRPGEHVLIDGGRESHG